VKQAFETARHITNRMKKNILYLIAFILPQVSLCQEKWMLTLDEVMLSRNRTFVQGDGNEGCYGLGA